MRKPFILTALFALAMTAGAQSASDPVLMTINGKPVTKAEFEYSYHKNGKVDNSVEKKSVKEYLPMFINYKLKVAEAEALKLDTLSSFKKEFQVYRDMQLTPYLIDNHYIDSIAYNIYNNTVKRIGGADLITTSHILIKLEQKATDADKEKAKAKADSIYNAIKQGADFGEMALKFSGDQGSAAQKGQLPMVGPGAFVKEYETAAYALKTGEMSKPVLSPFGYHIIRMDKRQQLDPFDKAKDQIIRMLKQRNIEAASSEHHIKQLVDASNGRLTREAVLDSVMKSHVTDNPQLRYLIQEYHDGLLLYEVSKKEVWDVAATDSTGLDKWYKSHKNDYAWEKPRFYGYVYHCKFAQNAKAVKKLLKKALKKDNQDFRKLIKQQFNKDSITVVVNGPYLSKTGDNPYIDSYAFKTGREPNKKMKGYAVSGAYGKIMKQPKSYVDVKPQVTNDYQNHLEEIWINNLRKKHTVTVNNDVLKTVK